LNTTDIFNDLVSDDDDDVPVKQDYDLDNLYVRERNEIEDQTDTMSEDDNEIESMDTQDQVLLMDRATTSQTSNRAQVKVICLLHFCCYSYSLLFFLFCYYSRSKKSMFYLKSSVNYLLRYKVKRRNKRTRR